MASVLPWAGLININQSKFGKEKSSRKGNRESVPAKIKEWQNSSEKNLEAFYSSLKQPNIKRKKELDDGNTSPFRLGDFPWFYKE